MNKKETLKFIFINFIYLAALCIVLAPLLWVSQYNVPTADDWSYGRNIHEVIQQGGGFVKIMQAICSNVASYYVKWEGRFINSMLASLQPGIWGEHYYAIVAWVMLAGLILGEMILFRILLYEKEKEERLLWIPVVIPTLLLQILYTPNTVESFYWYTGAVNYTFIFSLSMVFLALFWKLSKDDLRGGKRIGLGIIASILAVCVGGDNYSTSLSIFLSIMVFYFWTLVLQKKAVALYWDAWKSTWKKTWYLAVLQCGSFAACLLAPGNRARLNGNFGGKAAHGALWAIAQSLLRSFTNIYSWTNLRIILMLLLIAPFLWKKVRRTTHQFAYPGWFTFFSFGVYASQITANLYVDGTTGGGRAAAILYYSFHVWLVLNEYYWLGWLAAKFGKKSFVEKAGERIQRFLIVYCAVIGSILVAAILLRDLKELSSYRAYRDYKQGWAEQYLLEWNERLKVLKDESISEVVFEPLSVYPETFLYTDLQDEEGYIWVNKTCASYYGKKSVMVVSEE